jgi:hypothetical protein
MKKPARLLIEQASSSFPENSRPGSRRQKQPPFMQHFLKRLPDLHGQSLVSVPGVDLAGAVPAIKGGKSDKDRNVHSRNDWRRWPRRRGHYVNIPMRNGCEIC